MAQRSGGFGGASAQLRVRVVLENNHPVQQQVMVQLTTGIGTLIAQQYSDISGNVTFANLPSGTYRLKANGPGFKESEGDIFEIRDGDMMSFQILQMKLDERQAAVASAGPPVSALAMKVPEKARNEFVKGMELLQKGKKDEGMTRLTKATEIYPHYAEAFDWMGVAGLPAAKTEAKNYFQKAMDADDHYIPAYTHLARLLMDEKDNAGAEKLLLRATAFDATSPENLFLLSYLNLTENHMEACIDYAMRADRVPHAKFPIVHMVAAEAYARTGAKDKAIEQFKTYLKEAPQGDQAEQAKKGIQMLSAQSASAPPAQ
jgi:tetratricopeptide (TPR) repeat protein